MWIILSVLSAFGETAKDIVSKIESKKINAASLAISLHLFPLLILFPLLLLDGIPRVDAPFWWSLLLFLFIGPFWSILYMRAIKLSDISRVVPILIVSNLFTAIISPLFKVGFPSLEGWIGLSALTIGLYLIRLKDFSDVFDPIKSLVDEPGSRYMLLVAVLWSFSAHLSKINIHSSSAIMSSFSIALVSVIGLSMFSGNKWSITQLANLRVLRSIFILGLISTLIKLSVNYALIDGYAPYVTAIKRTSIFWSFWAGNVLFEEKVSNINWIGSIIMVIGVVLLALAK